MHDYVDVTICRSGEQKELKLRKGLGLMALSSKCQWLEFDCKKGDCGICIFQVREGGEMLSEPTQVEADFLRAMHADDTERLACQCRVYGPLTMDLEDFGPDSI